MYIQRKILAIIVISAILVSLISCAPAGEGGFLRVLDSAAEAKIEGSCNGVDFSATICLGAKDDNGSRDGKMTFTSPEALEGITVSTAGGVWGVELDGIAFSGISAELMGRPLAVFAETGEAVSAEKVTAEDGSARTLIILKSEAGHIEHLIDSKSGLPVSVTEKDAAGENVMEFEISEYVIKP